MPNFNMAQTPNGQPAGSDPGVYTNGIPQTYAGREYQLRRSAPPLRNAWPIRGGLYYSAGDVNNFRAGQVHRRVRQAVLGTSYFLPLRNEEKARYIRRRLFARNAGVTTNFIRVGGAREGGRGVLQFPIKRKIYVL